MLSIIAFVAVLSILIIAHELGHFFAARLVGVRVEKFSIGFGPKIIGIKRGDTEYMLSLVPLGGYVKMAGETPDEKIRGERWEFLSQSIGHRFRIIFAGPLLNYLLAFSLFALIFMIGAPTLSNSNRVGSLLDDFPAGAAGIQVGDQIVKIDGKEVKRWDEITQIIHGKGQGEVHLVVLRGNKKLEFHITPKIEAVKNIFGAEKKIALIGIAPAVETVRYGLPLAIYMAGKKLIILTGITYKFLGLMLIGKVSPREITGPIGIFMITQEATKLGFLYLLNLLAIISFNLAVVNLLPVPVMDGGHILFLGIEKLRGKPLSERMLERATQVGLALLVCLMIFVLYSDVVKFDLIERLRGIWHK